MSELLPEIRDDDPRRLLAGLVEGALTDDDRSQLKQLLAERPELLNQYLKQSLAHTMLSYRYATGMDPGDGVKGVSNDLESTRIAVRGELEVTPVQAGNLAPAESTAPQVAALAQALADERRSRRRSSRLLTLASVALVAVISAGVTWMLVGPRDSADGVQDNQPVVVELKEPAEPQLAKTDNGSTVTYRFWHDDLAGWENVRISAAENASRRFAAFDPRGADIDPNPTSGPVMVAPEPFGGYGRRQPRALPHETLILRSPTFRLSKDGEIRLQLTGGVGGADSPGSFESDLPPLSSPTGFLGIALRRVRTGEYVLSACRSTIAQEDTRWETIVFRGEDVSNLGEKGEVFTLDLIDAHHRNPSDWGWIGMDDVVIRREQGSESGEQKAEDLDDID